MERKSYLGMQCPIARSLERVGEWWSILILRDAFNGLTRFDQFEESLGIAPNMLTRRLQALVECGMLEKHRYQEHPPRYEYRLTEQGRDFRPVLWSLLAYGNRHFAPEGEAIVLVNRKTGAVAQPVLVDSVSGQAMTSEGFTSASTSVADARIRSRHPPLAEVRAAAKKAGPKSARGARHV